MKCCTNQIFREGTGFWTPRQIIDILSYRCRWRESRMTVWGYCHLLLKHLLSQRHSMPLLKFILVRVFGGSPTLSFWTSAVVFGSRVSRIPTLPILLHPLVVPIFSQVQPFRIRSLYQLDLPFPRPPFQSFFALDCCPDICCRFEINQFANVVSIRESIVQFMLMLIYSPLQVARYADVKCSSFAGKDIDTVGFHKNFSGFWTLLLRRLRSRSRMTALSICLK
jgi:hypothetical protein